MHISFEWDEDKNKANFDKHGIDFETAQFAFIDPKRVIAEDLEHTVRRKDIIASEKLKEES